VKILYFILILHNYLPKGEKSNLWPVFLQKHEHGSRSLEGKKIREANFVPSSDYYIWEVRDLEIFQEYLFDFDYLKMRDFSLDFGIFVLYSLKILVRLSHLFGIFDLKLAVIGEAYIHF